MLTVSYGQGDGPTNYLGSEPCRSGLPYKKKFNLLAGTGHTWTICGSETKTQVAENLR